MPWKLNSKFNQKTVEERVECVRELHGGSPQSLYLPETCQNNTLQINSNGQIWLHVVRHRLLLPELVNLLSDSFLLIPIQRFCSHKTNPFALHFDNNRCIRGCAVHTQGNAAAGEIYELSQSNLHAGSHVHDQEPFSKQTYQHWSLEETSGWIMFLYLETWLS